MVYSYFNKINQRVNTEGLFTLDRIELLVLRRDSMDKIRYDEVGVKERSSQYATETKIMDASDCTGFDAVCSGHGAVK